MGRSIFQKLTTARACSLDSSQVSISSTLRIRPLISSADRSGSRQSGFTWNSARTRSASTPSIERLRQNTLHNVPGHVREPEVSALKLVSQLGVVDAQRPQDSGMQIVNVNRIFHDVVAVVVGLAQADAGLDASA